MKAANGYSQAETPDLPEDVIDRVLYVWQLGHPTLFPFPPVGGQGRFQKAATPRAVAALLTLPAVLGA